MKVVDISKHNGIINFQTLKKFTNNVIIRCGYGDNIPSQDDIRFIRNIEQALYYGFNVGVYHYSYLGITPSVKSEYNHIKRLVEPYKNRLTLPIFIDCEESLDCGENVYKLVNMLKRDGYYVGIYCNQNYINNSTLRKYFNFYNGRNEKVYWWVARYSDLEPYGCKYDVWQYTEKGTIDGLSGLFDISVMHDNIPSIIDHDRYTKLAKEIWSGKWGNGAKRKENLQNAGYSWQIAQVYVNKLKGRC